jgi:hypothetical protein
MHPLLSMKKPQQFSISSIFAMLHQQPFDKELKQKVASGFTDELLIPDTVTFRPGVPGFPCWYLSSKKDPGMIKRKNTANVTAKNILEAFSRRPAGRAARNKHQGHGIIAVLVSDPCPNAQVSEQDEVGEATTEYLDEISLRDFLDRRSRSFSGILQRWVEPKSKHNSMLHATWTTKVCRVTCLTNVRSLTDRVAPPCDRAVTFDGSDAHVRRDPVSGQTSELVRYLPPLLVLSGHAASLTPYTPGTSAARSPRTPTT